jgi:hypothetical protein
MNKETILNSLSCSFYHYFLYWVFFNFFVDGRLGEFSRKSDDLSETGLIYGDLIWLNLIHVYSWGTFIYHVIPKPYKFPNFFLRAFKWNDYTKKPYKFPWLIKN